MQNQISSSCNKCVDYDICLLSMQDLSNVCAWYKKAYSRSNKIETVGAIINKLRFLGLTPGNMVCPRKM